MTPEQFKQLSIALPNEPGIYKYYSDELLVYVGKAKNIKKRVRSYFTKTFTSHKTSLLVKSITKIDFTITASEEDALLLENNLIKEFQPKYNINLKDDKTYPWIVIKNEPFPRIFLTRKKIPDGSEYIGPFTAINEVKDLLQFIKYQIPLRTCKLNLATTEIAKKKYKPCLEYHLGNCKAPCVGYQTVEDYKNDLQQVKNIVRGSLQPVIQHFKIQMQQYVEALAFEKAEIVRKKLDYLNQYNFKSTVTNFKINDADIFTIKKEDDTAVVNYMIVENGNIVNTHNQLINLQLDETEDEILQTAIPILKEQFNSKHTEIILPFLITLVLPDYFITIPKTGDKKKIIALSQKNSDYHLRELQRNKRLHLTNEIDIEQLLIGLQMDLQLQETPYHIECFDNSNLHGTNAVSAMVCFKNAQPSKSDYRHFNVSTVTGINDFATMKEVVYRRYYRLKEEAQPFPQLVIIDGGKGQLSAAYESIIELELQGKITLVGLAKNIEEIFFIGDAESIKLPYNGNSLSLIRRIRDEVHNFGINHHRRKRSKATFVSELDAITGIGKATKDLLLKKLKSVNKIKQSSLEQIAEIIGVSKAKIVVQALGIKK
jgi:excinuclease ABC subunit C